MDGVLVCTAHCVDGYWTSVLFGTDWNVSVVHMLRFTIFLNLRRIKRKKLAVWKWKQFWILVFFSRERYDRSKILVQKCYFKGYQALRHCDATTVGPGVAPARGLQLKISQNSSTVSTKMLLMCNVPVALTVQTKQYLNIYKKMLISFYTSQASFKVNGISMP